MALPARAKYYWKTMNINGKDSYQQKIFKFLIVDGTCHI